MGPFKCCDHCRTEDQYKGSHANPCGYRGCPGSVGTKTRDRARTARLLVLAGAMFSFATAFVPSVVIR